MAGINHKKTFTREDFCDHIFQPYNAAVKRGKYQKIDYGMWRELRAWLYDDEWKKWYIVVTKKNDDYVLNMERIDQSRTSRQSQLHTHDGNGLGTYLHDIWDGAAKTLCVEFNKQLEEDFKSALASCATSISVVGESAKAAAETISDSLAFGRDGLLNSLKFDYYAPWDSPYDPYHPEDWETTYATTTDYNSNQYYYDYGIGSLTTNDYTINIDPKVVRLDDTSLDVYLDKVVQDNIAKIIVKEEEKENNEMNFANFDFGPVDSSVHMSMYGMAIKNASGTYVSYDAENKQIVDVDILNFDGAQKFMYKMPVAIDNIAVGDVVVHARKPMFVVAVRKDGKLAVVDPHAGEEKVIMLTRSPFGFNFATKVVSLFNFGSADASNPFGNMLPLFLLSDNKNSDDMLPLLFMMNGQSAMANNPMLMYALMSKDAKMKDMLPFLMMCGNPVQPSGCCGGNCHCHDEISCDKEG